MLQIRRLTDFTAKLEFCDACRQKGNDRFGEGDYTAAIVEYERALSVWNWVESSLPDWKKNVCAPLLSFLSPLTHPLSTGY